MTESYDYDSWLRGIINKRPVETIQVLAALISAGLRNGRVTADDVPDLYLPQRNCIGAAFKVLHRCGFSKSGDYVKAKKRNAHGRIIDVWELTDGVRAQRAVNAFRGVLVKSESGKYEQGVLI